MADRAELMSMLRKAHANKDEYAKTRLMSMITALDKGDIGRQSSQVIKPEAPLTGGSILNPIGEGVLLGAGDEVAALGAATVGEALPEGMGGFPASSKFADSYQQILNQIRGETEAYAEREPSTAAAAELASALPGGIAAGGKMLATEAAKRFPKVAAAAVPGAEGAFYGAATGETPEERLEGAGKQGGLSAILGPVLGKALQVGAEKMTTPAARGIMDVISPRLDATQRKLKAQAHYNAAEKSDIVIRKDVFSRYVDSVAKKLDDSGYDPANQDHAPMRRIVNRLGELKDRDVSMADMIKLNALVDGALKKPGSMRLANIVQEGTYKRAAQNLKQKDLVKGDIRPFQSHMEKADAMWGQGAKGKVLEKAVAKAERSGANQTGGDMDKALSAQLRSILNSESKSKKFSPEELDAMDAIIEGSGWQNFSRMIKRRTDNTVSPLANLGATGGMYYGSQAGNTPMMIGSGIVLGLNALAPMVNKVATGRANKSTTKKTADLIDTVINQDNPLSAILKRTVEPGNAKRAATAAGSAATLPSLFDL